MNKFLFLLFCVASGHSQTANIYSGVLQPNLVDGLTERGYYILESSDAINHSEVGENLIWDFSGIAEIGGSVYWNTVPTAEQAADFPGTTMTTNHWALINDQPYNSKFFSNSNNGYGTFQYTGISNDLFALTYTDAALVGNFPLTYGYTATDALGGTFTYGSYSGSFTGNIQSVIDASGTLLVGLPLEAVYTTPAVRLKTVQILDLSYPVIGNAGSVTITAYEYFTEDFMFHAWPMFRTRTISISVPLLSIDQTSTVHEFGYPALLSTPEYAQASISATPNPVKDVLHIQSDTAGRILEATVSDLTGKTILRMDSPGEQINLNGLWHGLYFISLHTENGTVTKKIIKE